MIQDIYGASPQLYSVLFGINAVCLVAGAQVTVTAIGTPADGYKWVQVAYGSLTGWAAADYLSVALKAYQTEGNPRVGRANGIMVGMAKGLSKQDIQELAQYFASLPGDVKTVPQSRTRR